jgi:hypothetical protein
MKKTILLKNGLRVKVDDESSKKMIELFEAQLQRQPWRLKEIKEG